MLPWPEIITTGISGWSCLSDVEQLQAVEAASLQPDVEEDEVRPARDHCRERLIGCRAAVRVPWPSSCKNAGDQFADIRLIIHNEDIGCHGQTARLLRLLPAPSALSIVSAAKRNCIHAPRAPGIFSDASRSSMWPPCSSRMRPTIASPSPVPFSRVVT